MMDKALGLGTSQGIDETAFRIALTADDTDQAHGGTA
jgi:hypothetical protein